ncbi:MAG: dihydropteroate synthase [Planktomarina sp.]
MTAYRPILASRQDVGVAAVQLADGWLWFDRVEVLEYEGRSIVPVSDIPADVLDRLTTPRAAMVGLDWSRPQIMGILNVTPDSFSDGGVFNAPEQAVVRAQAMAADGADILDIGGESTRPGAGFVPVEEEIQRTAPIISALVDGDVPPLSIDTRKAAVAVAAVQAGADMLNDVSALSFDDDMASVAAKSGAPICLMHAQGDPATMQKDPSYRDVTLDVYHYLEDRIAVAEAAGVQRSQIIVDPGIGFGKTLDHNLQLLRDLAVFHGLGCPVLLGASRKRFIGTLSGAKVAADRMAGSVAVALAGVAQGMQIVRVHDVAQTHQAMTLWGAVR